MKIQLPKTTDEDVLHTKWVNILDPKNNDHVKRNLAWTMTVRTLRNNFPTYLFSEIKYDTGRNSKYEFHITYY